MRVSRRSFIKRAASLGAISVGAGGFPMIARAAKTITLTMATASPLTHVISNEGAEPWMKRVKELTHGQVEFKYFPAGQISTMKDLLSSLNTNIADIAPIAVGYNSNKLPLNGVAMLPGLGNSCAEITRNYSAAMRKGLLFKEYQQNGVFPLFIITYPPYQVVSAVRPPILTPDDFKGKVLRSAGGSMNILISALGASPAEIPVSDMYVSLQRGTVSGTLSNLMTLKPYHIDELATAISYNASFGTFTNVFSINQKKWEGLPEDVRKAMLQAADEVGKKGSIDIDGLSEQAIKDFAQEKIHMFKFTDEQLAALDEKFETVRATWVKRYSKLGTSAQEVLDSYSAMFKA